MKLSKAIEGYLIDLRARGFSEQTLRLYGMYLPKVTEFLKDPEVDQVTGAGLNEYMVYIRTQYVPKRFSGDQSPLSASAVDNHWECIRSFFKWCNVSLEIPRPDINLYRPKFKLPPVSAFTEEEIKRLVEGCVYNREKNPKNASYLRKRRPTADRDKALVLLLLDTGLRVGEFCRLKIEDVDIETGEVTVAPHGSGQKTKPRAVYLGNNAKRAMWLFIAKKQKPRPTDKLFLMTEKSIRALLRHLGERMNVKHVHSHRFRHTFAIWYLRNGGDVFTLARQLGHSGLEMTMHYLNIVGSDVENAHRRASPGDKWNF
jgi:integrase/recombinase XerD